MIIIKILCFFFFGVVFSFKTAILINDVTVDESFGRKLCLLYPNCVVFYSIEEYYKQAIIQQFDFFFYKSNKIIPEAKALGKKVNIYMYTNDNENFNDSNIIIDYLSSYDLVFNQNLIDLKHYLMHANSVLIELARQSKYVPLIRIIGADFNESIKKIVERISREITLKEYILESLPLFKLKTVSIEPRLKSKNVAVIVESAVHPALELCVRNVMYYLNSSWSLIIIHSEENEIFVKSVLQDLQNIEYRLPPSPIYSVSAYNQFMKTADFYKSLNAEKVLIFQTDSLMLRGGMEKFMKYDYIGAPWNWGPTQERSGNGGFSLRSVDVLIKACLTVCNHRNQNINEDVIFSNFIFRNRNYLQVPYLEAYSFSREVSIPRYNVFSVENGVDNFHMAMHQAWLFSSEESMRKIFRSSINNLKQ